MKKMIRNRRKSIQGRGLPIAALALLLALGVFGLSGAGLPAGVPSAGTAMAEQAAGAGKLRIVGTIFPAFDFARAVAGDAAEVTMLLPPGGDSHSYEPTPQDVISIQNADLFIYVGGESDAWIARILDSMGADAPRALRMEDCVTVLAEEQSASMEAEHGEEEHGEGQSEEMDEHVWTSPKNAMLIVDAVRRELSEISPNNAAQFGSNAHAYQQELEALDAAFEAVVAGGKRRLMVFGDRFPFRYFAAAYGLRYDAAFPGCSEDSEPSVKTVMSLVEAIQREQVPVVFYIEFSSRKTADVLAEETGARELLFHSCHTVSAEELANGVSYLSLMRGNVDALKEALN